MFIKTLSRQHSLIQSPLWVPLLFLFCSTSFSQNISTSDLLWEADEATDLQTQNVIAYKAKFKTMGTGAVEWIQKKGQLTTSYSVTGTEGTWTDISTDGSFTYLLTRNGNSSKLTVEKSSSGTFITFDFSKAGEYSARQRFRIQSVQPTN